MCFATSDVCVCADVQEADLERMRGQWLEILTQRQEYLDQQLQKIVCKPGTEQGRDLVLHSTRLVSCCFPPYHLLLMCCFASFSCHNQVAVMCSSSHHSFEATMKQI